MFALFFSLYYAMFNGSWYLFDFKGIHDSLRGCFNDIGTFLTSIFGDNTYNNLGNGLLPTNYFQEGILGVVSFVLALITSIGIVFAAGKVLKRIFGVFFVLGR